jgi:hypothetical protein
MVRRWSLSRVGTILGIIVAAGAILSAVAVYVYLPIQVSRQWTEIKELKAKVAEMEKQLPNH